MRKLLIANIILTSLLLAAVLGLAVNQARLDSIYQARWDWQGWADTRQFQLLNHQLMPDKYPLPTAVELSLQQERAQAQPPPRPAAP